MPNADPPEPAPPRAYAALIYCARSGSTFLAHRLDAAAPDIAVLPEFTLPQLLFWMGEARVRALDPAGLAELFREDAQFVNLGLSDAAAAAIAQTCAGQGARAILDAVIDAHLRRVAAPGCKLAILKNGALAINAERTLETFPELRFLHVRRDPRGVANSMIRTASPFDDGKPMARGDAIHAAKLWRRYMARVRALAARAPVLDIAYEDLVADPEAAIARIRAWLGAAPAPAGQGRPGFQVPPPERALHQLAAGAPQPARAEAWARELPPWLRAGVESVAAADMDRLGYPRPQGGAPMPLRARLHHLWRGAAHYLSAARRYLGWLASDPRRARVRMRQFLMRLTGRN